MGICFTLLSSFSNLLGIQNLGDQPIFSWSWLYAAGGVGGLLLLRNYFDKSSMNKLDAQQERNFEPDTENGLLQTIKRDEMDRFELQLTQKIKLNHDSYFLR